MTEQSFPDPRPRLETSSAGMYRLRGWRCTACGHALALAAPWCPECRGKLEPGEFGPAGTVWSSTVLRVALPGREPPSVLAYVDLDEGPRILAHVSERTARLHVGERVQLTAPSSLGDLSVCLTGSST